MEAVSSGATPRGRGRGRGAFSYASLNQPGSAELALPAKVPEANQFDESEPETKPAPSVVPVEIIVSKAAATRAKPHELTERLVSYFPDGAADVARALHSSCLDNRDFSATAARCCQELTLLDNGGEEFRKHLLRTMQTDFNNRATIFEKSESDFLSCASLLCEVFSVVRNRNGEPFMPLATPVVEYLSMMLQDFSLTETASRVLADNLQIVGPILREKAPDKERALIESVRQKILDEKTESLTRCQMLRLLESSLAGWSPLSDEIESFYQQNLNSLRRNP